jgi:hypothetical protein
MAIRGLYPKSKHKFNIGITKTPHGNFFIIDAYFLLITAFKTKTFFWKISAFFENPCLADTEREKVFFLNLFLFRDHVKNFIIPAIYSYSYCEFRLIDPFKLIMDGNGERAFIPGHYILVNFYFFGTLFTFYK